MTPSPKDSDRLQTLIEMLEASETLDMDFMQMLFFQKGKTPLTRWRRALDQWMKERV